MAFCEAAFFYLNHFGLCTISRLRKDDEFEGRVRQANLAKIYSLLIRLIQRTFVRLAEIPNNNILTGHHDAQQPEISFDR